MRADLNKWQGPQKMAQDPWVPLQYLKCGKKIGYDTAIYVAIFG